MGTSCCFSFGSLPPLLPSLPTSSLRRTLSSSVPCVWGLSSLGGAWDCPACCGDDCGRTPAPVPPTWTVGAVLLQADFGGWWVQGGRPVCWEPRGGVKSGQVMSVAWQEEEGQFVLWWRGRVILRAKRPFEGQMLIWDEKQKAAWVGEAWSRGWVSCDSAIR